jgi:hypothetical protein
MGKSIVNMYVISRLIIRNVLSYCFPNVTGHLNVGYLYVSVVRDGESRE